MVRTQSQVSSRPLGIDTSRVLAMSTAVALHLLAGGLLLIPLSHHQVMQPPTPKERWLMPITVPATPPPPTMFPVEVKFKAPSTRTPVIADPVVKQPPVTQTAVVDTAHVALEAVSDTAPTISAPAAPFKRAGGRRAAALSQRARTELPGVALRAGQQGTVMLRVLVGTDGRPAEVSVQTSSGHRALDLAARSQVLRSWRFQPAMQNGQAVQAYGLVPVSFSLN